MPAPVRQPASSRFRPGPDTLARRIGDEVVLVHLKTDRIYVLNRTGGRLWDLLCADHDRAEIERRVRQEMDVRDAELTSALDEIIASLLDESLIEPCGES